MKKLYYILSALRIHNSIIGILAGYIAALIINPSIHIGNIYMILLEIFCVMSFGNLINDFQDVESDKIAHPKRAVASNKISFNEIKLFLIILIILIITISINFTIIVNLFLYGIILPLLIFYNKVFKPIPILGNIVISFLLCSVFIFIELFILQSFRVLCFPTILIFSFSFIREFLKDIQDYHGDSIAEIHTFPVVFGVKNSITVAIILIFLFCVILLLPYYFYSFNLFYLYSIIILIEFPLIIIVFLLLNNPSNQSFKSIALLTKVMSLVGLLIIFILYR